MSKALQINKATYVPKIKDTKNLNAYGVLLHTRKAVEDFQKRSGMEGKYTKEYQYHYWAANARLHVDQQILDISIPLVMFNYEQEVTGGNIKFDLVDVSKVSTSLTELAKKKFKELTKTPVYKYITEIGITDWQFVPLNTSHVHPGAEHQRFSGIDLRASSTYPGVVFPLTTGVNIPSFSSIMAHIGIDDICKLVHSEYRLFNEAENGDKIYEQGRCATIVKGYTPEPIPEPEPVPQRMIDKIFNIEPEQPKKVKQPTKMITYTLLENLKYNEGKEFLSELEKAWEETDYEPDTKKIFKKNIKNPAMATRYPTQQKGYNTNRRLWPHEEEYEKPAFGKTKKQDGRNANKKDNSSEVSFYDQKRAIVEAEYATWQELMELTHKDILDLYEMTLAMESLDEEFPEPGEYDELEGIETITLREGEDYGYSSDEIIQIRILLFKEQYLSHAKINEMSDMNIAAYFNAFYQIEGE